MTRAVDFTRLATKRPRPKHRRHSEKALTFVRRRALPMFCSSERRKRRSDVRRPQLPLREGHRNEGMMRRRTTRVLPDTAGKALRHLTTVIIPTHILLAVDTSTLHLSASNRSNTVAGHLRHRHRATIVKMTGGASAVENTTSSSSITSSSRNTTVFVILTKHMNARGGARVIFRHRTPTMVRAAAVARPFQTAHRKKTRR
mmetsp:Transcript_17390/g.41198  ORF Transcript_17390/g.41198 Transcript_17390/m.41198 type:complete len:201 (+) Transcript_17390:2184-2786(+)